MNVKEQWGILAAIHRSGLAVEKVESSLTELERLADTAGITTLYKVIQKREAPDPATYIGKGKIAEIAALIESSQADIVIINDSLSPVQIRNLENQLETRVIDRTQLILDIFATRARTKESKIQVELAQYQYMLPRLTGIGRQLSRLGGGIGTRGPGETKLETDRRRIRERIADLSRELADIKKQRQLHQNRRKKNGVYQVILTGYTNAGKSSLLNRLTEADVLEEDRLFATLDPTSRRLKLPIGISVLLTDTVGFIQDLPTHLVAAFRSTLEVVQEADLILHVIDSSDPDYPEKIRVVEELLNELGAIDIPRIEVYNKKDRLSDPTYAPPMNEHSLLISAFDPDDRQKLLYLIQEKLLEQLQFFHQKIPFTQPEVRTGLYKNCLITKDVENVHEGYWDVEGYFGKEVQKDF